MENKFRKTRIVFPNGKTIDKIKSFYYTIFGGSNMEKFINRKEYLDNLIKFKEIDVIKVITGVRRSRKVYII